MELTPIYFLKIKEFFILLSLVRNMSEDNNLVKFKSELIPEEEANVLKEIEDILEGSLRISKERLGYFDKFTVYIQNNTTTELNIVECRLQTLPPSIGDLKGLKQLDLSFDSLMYLPDSIGELKKLEWLMLTDNKLKKLPDSIGNLTKLKKLELGSNNLMKLPSSIIQLKSLQSLDIHGNPLLDQIDTDLELNDILQKLEDKDVEIIKKPLFSF